ncbi:MAG TPA: glycoside hydrolase family 97 protein [Candidatus Eremiobacteraceae bacterium]|nr:glycoside hydrolase family 97 protein [Candidatus Eremiobacteraceae bacterium]
MSKAGSSGIKFVALLLVAVFFGGRASADSSYSLKSPDNRIEVQIHVAKKISYDVLLNNKVLLKDSTLAINIDGKTLGENPQVKSTKKDSADKILEPVVRQKFAKIREWYNELKLEMDGGYAVTFRAYPEGAAYRLETSLGGENVKVFNEEAIFRFLSDFTVYYPEEESMFSHNERKYLPRKLSSIPEKTFATLPAVVDAGDGVKVAVAESGVEDYPGLWLRGTSDSALSATFEHFPLKETLTGDRDFKVTEAADYIAVTKGTRTFPWRALGIAEHDKDLISNSLIWLLEKPSMLSDTSWIKPGKVAWDWWNANNVYGVDFRAGINTQTYKYYIDFAAKNHLDYIILDEGWYKLGNVLEVVPEINMEELTSYAKQKNVGVILWVIWKSLDDQMIPALDQYAKWGIKGIKVDFMQRNDQKLLNFYYKLTSECAKRHMLVDYHGAQRGASLTRTWPNLISNEGVRGMEWSKWSAETDPPHNVTLPFTRMFLGPMDYTPGAMLNAQKTMFAPIFARPMALGTRCQQLAMYVVFESPLQMLSDTPSNYEREPESLEFLRAVPSTWDETIPLDGKISEYVVVARRNGKEWYAGAMSNWDARDLEIDFSFLPEGNFTMDAYQDGINADRMASDYKKTTTTVSKATKLKIHLAPGGGWAAHIHQ